MGFFKKKKVADNADSTTEVHTSTEGHKPYSDKSIKPKAPKGMAMKLMVRILFWCFVGFIMIKGIVSFAQGTRIIEKVTNIGSDQPAIADSVKGFAADFATEYFTWNISNVNDRNGRLSKFIDGIEQDAGLKASDVKGASRVTSVEIYAADKIDDTHIDVTVLVRRDVQLSQQVNPAPASNADDKLSNKKTYVVVPITITPKGPVIRTYPRFVGEQLKGEAETVSYGKSVSDATLIKKAQELSESFLRSWYEGNVSQLKYFYAINIEPPSDVKKSAFSLERVEKISVSQLPGTKGDAETLRINASIIVKNDIGELFMNAWVLNAVEKDGRLYMFSLGETGKQIPDQKAQQNTSKSDTDSNKSNIQTDNSTGNSPSVVPVTTN